MLLIANRDLRDPNFSRSVVLITHFDATGTVGLILNRPLPMPATEALPPLAPLQPDPGVLFLGGPVAVGTLQLLLRTGADLDPGSRIVADVHLIEGADMLQDLVEGRIQATALRLYAGYAGWGPGQLESELLRGDWILWTSDADTIFATDPERLWPELVDRATERWVRPATAGSADVAARSQYNLPFATGPDRGNSSTRGALPCLHSAFPAVRVANERGLGACGPGRQPTC
jgi:putative transcriptional regulator